MARLFKAVISGLLIGALGVMASIVPFGLDLEENIGLDLMFRLRGFRDPPSDVVIVSLDNATVHTLQLPTNPEKWPRSLHANLVENLVQKGAAVIVFDMMFNEPGLLEQDNSFAQAIRKAGNVVLCQCLQTETVPLTDKDGRKTGELIVEKLIQPIPSLEHSALALAPFPLPKVPVKVSQYWTFKTEAGDTPTLPVTVFQIFVFKVYDEFIQLLEKVSPSQTEKLLRDKDTIIERRWIEETMLILRNLFQENPLLGKKMVQEIRDSGILSSDVKKKRILKSLINIYQGPKSRYLNFYGPPGTIKNISYYQFLKHDLNSSSKPMKLDLRGKVVFVGLSENMRIAQKDGFYTVFSQPNGVDISGVEIAASAFANLLEDNPVQPLVYPVHHLTIFLWGILLSLLCFFLSPVLAAVGVISLSILYLTAAVAQFKNTGSWYPVVVPLFFQAPVAYFGIVLWKFFETSKERQNIKSALEYYLPEREVRRLSKNIGDIKKNIQTVYGTCLFTDVEEYTSISENIAPQELAGFINKYFGAVFEPVRKHGGFVSDIKGDSMLSVWATADPDIAERRKACLAALDILSSVQQFKHYSDTLYFPTRIGLHSGFISLGSVGAINRYEYRPLGDIVNTASRIENLNKYLGTRILASEEVLDRIDGLMTRKLGKFLFAGKSKAVTVYELISRLEESDVHQKNLCAIFTQGLDAYNKQSWEEAINAFYEVTKTYKEDGPSTFYLRLCEKYKINPPEETWDGVVILRTK
jgi:adenylate cyclase